MMNLKIKSFSKINIGLNVYEQGSNNKHKIKSIFMLIDDYTDDIEISESNENKVSYFINNEIINIPNDIVIQILEFLNNQKKLDKKFNIKITKNIPFNAGLGGSSSNAGTILKTICSYFKINLTPQDLKHIALYYGSDIPFFASGFNLALVSGYGNEIRDLSYLSKPKYKLIPCYWNVSTKQLYNKYDSITYRINKNDYDWVIKNWELLDQINFYNDLFLPAVLVSKNFYNFYKEKSKDFDKPKINMTGSGSFLYIIQNNKIN